LISEQLKKQKLFLKSKNGQNIFWLIGEKIVRLPIAILIGAMLARYLGTEDFGQWNFAITVIMLIQIIPNWGLSQIIVRELVISDSKEEILGSVFVVKVLFGVISIAGCILYSIFFANQKDVVGGLVIFLSIIFIFQSFDIIDYFFQSIVKAKYVVIAKLGGFLVASIIKLYLILINAHLIYFSLSYVTEFGLIALILIFYNQKFAISIGKWKFEKKLAISFIIKGAPLMFSSMAAWLYFKMDQIFIKEIANYAELGIYSASLRIIEATYFIPEIILQTFFPWVLKSLNRKKEFNRRLVTIGRHIMLLAIIISLGGTLSGKQLINFIYGNEFKDAGYVFIIHIWILNLIALKGIASRFLIAHSKNKAFLILNLVGVALNILLNLWLIPHYGAIGATIASLLSILFSSVLINFIFPETRELFFIQLFCIKPSFVTIKKRKNVK
jgi:O-antigen/teichoic acid export membrane protein